MAEPMEVSSPEHSLKRSLPDDDDDQMSISKSESQVPTPPLTASPANKDSVRQPSPALSTSTLSSVPSNGQPADPNAPPKKRRKYTPAEKEERRLEKEQKDKERAELKVKRDEEKQKKDEEKRRKNEEKEAKQREKDLKKTREEEEKQRKLKVGSLCTLSLSFAH
jgi:chromatin assembly factor 1 subunit A